MAQSAGCRVHWEGLSEKRMGIDYTFNGHNLRFQVPASVPGGGASRAGIS